MGQFRTADGSIGAIIYRGTSLRSDEIGKIQSLIDAHPTECVIGIAGLVCERFDWRRPNGDFASISCGGFLRRLAKHGLIRGLPPPRVKLRSRCNIDNDHAEILEFLGPIAGMVECQPVGPLLVRPIAAEEYDGFRLHLKRYHYLGFTKPSGESLCYAAIVGDEVVGLLVWSAAVLHNAHRDRLIGWDSATRQRNLSWVVNHSRFLVLPWIRQPHLASRILGANLRRLSHDWEVAYGHSVYLAETFVDTQRFRGTCYRARNWTYLGMTRGFSRTRHSPRGFVPNQRPKAVLVYPIHRHALQRLRAEILPASAAQARIFAGGLSK